MLRTALPLFLLLSFSLKAQDKDAGDPNLAPDDRAVKLAMDGRCKEALPLLGDLMNNAGYKVEVKRTIAFAGVRCAMLQNEQTEAVSFLAWLQQSTPHDPEVLFLATHVFSELSLRNSQDLMETAPGSPLVIQLNAENFQKQGDLKKAIAEYRILLQRAPHQPGIHFRIGGLIMALPSTAANLLEARKEFEEELKINPQNPGTEYYLGELSRQAGRLPQAIAHFSQAIKFYPEFGDAYFGLGRSLLDSGKATDAIKPLETAAKYSPANPTVHLSLATAYQRAGRKEDAAREFALQKTTAEKLNQNAKTLRKTVSGIPAP